VRLNEKAKDKFSDVCIHLGEAAIIASVGSFFIEGVKLYFAIGGILPGCMLIFYGIILTNQIGKEN
jgi:hypothetical protein